MNNNDARSQATSGKRSGMVGYNIRWQLTTIAVPRSPRQRQLWPNASVVHRAGFGVDQPFEWLFHDSGERRKVADCTHSPIFIEGCRFPRQRQPCGATTGWVQPANSGPSLPTFTRTFQCRLDRREPPFAALSTDAPGTAAAPPLPLAAALLEEDGRHAVLCR